VSQGEFRVSQPSRTAGSEADRHGRLPENLYRFILETSAIHQLLLLVLSAAIFLIELVPLELQRRIVNDLVKHRPYQAIVLLCAVYAGIGLCHGGLKLVLNVYRGWVGEVATRDLRRRVSVLLEPSEAHPQTAEANGIGVSMIVSEAEPIGSFVGESVSEPILQAGVLLSVIAYMGHLEPWMAVTTLALFVPQLMFVPLMQGAINRRSATRVWTLRRLSVGLVERADTAAPAGDEGGPLIDRVFTLNMGIFRLKFSMNFLMNFCNHLQIIAVLLLGGWFVVTDQLEIGGVVAFISAIGRLNDPWGDLVNYFRDVTVTQVKFGLLANAVNQLAAGRTRDFGEEPAPVIASD
jgi:ABC-type multidrug transport system fused ATPase/permease subunit